MSHCRRRRVWLLAGLVSLLILLLASPAMAATEEAGDEIVRVRVLDVMKLGEGEEWTGIPDGVLEEVTVEFLDGPLAGEETRLDHHRGHHPALDLVPEEGETYLAALMEEDGEVVDVYLTDHVRDTPLAYMAAVFALLLLVVGGMRGVRALVSLGLIMIVFAYGFLPLLLAGWPPIALAVGTSALVTVLTLAIIGGWKRKTLAAVGGTTVGVLAAGILAYIFGGQAELTGLAAREAEMLLYLPEEVGFDFQGLLFAGIIIGALGAVMDVAMSVASAVEEMQELNPGVSPRRLFASGLNVGRDVMGTMANTLVLAYAGTSVPLLLLFLAHDTPLPQLLNLEFMATEVIRALAGSTGLVLSIPATAFFAAWRGGKGART